MRVCRRSLRVCGHVRFGRIQSGLCAVWAHGIVRVLRVWWWRDHSSGRLLNADDDDDNGDGRHRNVNHGDVGHGDNDNHHHHEVGCPPCVMYVAERDGLLLILIA